MIMGFADRYIKSRVLYDSFLGDNVPEDLKIIITIPCYNEPDIIQSLESLAKCDPISGTTEVIIVINSSERDNNDIIEANNNTCEEIEQWISGNKFDGISFYVVKVENLPRKHAGVGLARKIAMDEALRRFNAIEKPDGVITGFDADTLCDRNYLTAIEDHFSNKKSRGASIYFEHPVEGTEYSEKVYEASAFYELYLRYYKTALGCCGHPYAFYCIGSAYAVRAFDYASQGGMNKKQAGEDFYFLQKIISLGGFGEINSTRVIPSSRISDRTPFGTGRSISEIKSCDQLDYPTYNIVAFKRISKLLQRVDDFYKCDDLKYSSIVKDFPVDVREYCESISFKDGIKEINSNCSSLRVFQSKFFKYFNVLNVLKYLNYIHINELKKESVLKGAYDLLAELRCEYKGNKDVFSLLKYYRERDRYSK